jgi:hypothetical protein
VVNNYEQELNFACVATCKSFRIETLPSPGGGGVTSPRDSGSAAPFCASGSSTPGTNPSTPGGPMARGGSGSGGGMAPFSSRPSRAASLLLQQQQPQQQQQQQPRTLMVFEGCTRGLAATVLLKGADLGELTKLKRVVSFAALAAYHLRIEDIFLAEELTAATCSGVADGGPAGRQAAGRLVLAFVLLVLLLLGWWWCGGVEAAAGEGTPAVQCLAAPYTLPAAASC